MSGVVSRRDRWIGAVFCFAAGVYPLIIAFGWVRADPGTVHGPTWILALTGFIFPLAGCMILLSGHRRLNTFLTGVLLLAFGILGGWIALLGAGEQFSGNVLFLPAHLGILVARGMFGFGSAICLLFSGLVFYRAARGT